MELTRDKKWLIWEDINSAASRYEHDAERALQEIQQDDFPAELKQTYIDYAQFCKRQHEALKQVQEAWIEVLVEHDFNFE
jgi:uncharacterized protein YecT (DUF1311 family)